MDDHADMLIYKCCYDRIQSAFYKVERNDHEDRECIQVCNCRVDLCSHCDDVLDSAESNFCVERKCDRAVYEYSADDSTDDTGSESDHSGLFRFMSAVDQENRDQMEAMASELCQEYIAKNDELANKNDMTALFRIGYGLYVVTSNDGKKDNGLIVNTVTQLTDSPFRVAVNINKTNYSHHVIKQTGVLNVNCLSVEAPFSVFEQFGFQSGRSADKFAGQKVNRSDNGLVFLDKYINAFMSLKVEQYVDLGTHGMFICSVTEARVVSDQETMSYTYYQKNVKPKPETEGKKGFVCKVCGYIYEGDELPEDYICPLCKHGAVDFEPIG